MVVPVSDDDDDDDRDDDWDDDDDNDDNDDNDDDDSDDDDSDDDDNDDDNDDWLKQNNASKGWDKPLEAILQLYQYNINAGCKVYSCSYNAKRKDKINCSPYSFMTALPRS